MDTFIAPIFTFKIYTPPQRSEACNYFRNIFFGDLNKFRYVGMGILNVFSEVFGNIFIVMFSWYIPIVVSCSMFISYRIFYCSY